MSEIHMIFFPNSKPAQLEGLEVDQYMWSILNTTENLSEVEEVTIDPAANWKAAKNMTSIKSEEESNDCKRISKAMSPGSMNMPTMNNWDMTQAMSPYMAPDMNSIVSGSMMNNSTPSNYPNNNVNHRNSTGNYDLNAGTTTTTTNTTNTVNNEYVNGSGPLSHLSESVNSLDPLNAMEKSLNDQVRFDTVTIFYEYLFSHFLMLTVSINYLFTDASYASYTSHTPHTPHTWWRKQRPSKRSTSLSRIHRKSQHVRQHEYKYQQRQCRHTV